MDEKEVNAVCSNDNERLEESTECEDSESVQSSEASESEGSYTEDFVHPERDALRQKAEAKRRAINAEMKKISMIDPSIKSFDDLMLMENAEEFAQKVKKGYSLSDAFIITNSKKLTQRIKSSAVRSALLKSGAKKHLTGAGSNSGEAAIDVPAETYSLYKSLYPELSDREIKKHYKKHNK